MLPAIKNATQWSCAQSTQKILMSVSRLTIKDSATEDVVVKDAIWQGLQSYMLVVTPMMREDMH